MLRLPSILIGINVFFLFINVVYAQHEQVNGFAISRISPKPFSSRDLKQPVLSLNGNWRFNTDAGNQPETIKVPGEWEMQGFMVNEGETGHYAREFSIPSDWRGQRIKVRLDGVSSHAVIKVNGKKIGEHEGSFVPFEMDITSAISPDKNILQVDVQAQTISDKLACTSQYAVHTVGGILRSVVLFALPETNISDIDINIAFDTRYTNATMRLTTKVAHESGAVAIHSLLYTLRDASGRIVIKKKIPALPLTALNLAVKKPLQWNPEHPYLYELTTDLFAGGEIVETVRQKVGFRQIEIKGNLLLVNGKPVKLRGVCRHSIYPLTGRSISDDLEIRDAVLFRDGNCNYIRTSHYPPSEAFLQACDSLGLFVESESSLCWINHGASPIWKLWNFRDDKFLPYMVNANLEKMAAQKNHPSIIIWSLGNESVWSDLWAKVNETVKKMDPSRPTTFHDQCWGGFNNAGSKADIAVYHYPGIDGAAACDTMKRPVLFGEYAHVSCYSRRELITDPGVREGYGAPLAQLYDSMYHHATCLGGAIWSGIDDIFDMPDGRIIGYGPWGPIDAWRRPKPEYYGMKKAYSPIVVTHLEYPDSINKTLSLTIENRYDFTDAREIAIKYTINGIEKYLVARIAPHGKGIVRIPVEQHAKDISIIFTDPRGFVANEEKILLQHDLSIEPENVAVSATESESSLTIRQGNITYQISKLTGIIVSIRRQDKLIVSTGPVFGVVPMNDDDGGKPNVAGETYQNDIYPLKNYSLYTLFAKNFSMQSGGDSILITMNVFYHGGSFGKQSYLFSKDGTLTAAYEVKYNGNDSLPRQYGMMMQLPVTFEKLNWKRKGHFSVYPPNDIGRTAGSATLQAKHTTDAEEWGVVPKNDWKDDANDLGSNDFRSTKANIYRASLRDTANAVEIISDATQSSRTWLQDKQIQWLIADYNNNGSEPFYDSPFTNGRTNIKGKILKGKLVLFIR